MQKGFVNCACVVGACGHIFDLRCAIALFILVDRGADEYVNRKCSGTYIDTEHRSISRDILLCSVPIRFTYSSAPLSTRFKCTATYYTIFFQADHINLARQDFFFFLRLATLILRPNFQSRFFSFHRNSWAVSDKERF